MFEALAVRGRLGPGVFTHGWLAWEDTAVIVGYINLYSVGLFQSGLTAVTVRWP